jgi:hypothetical protein
MIDKDVALLLIGAGIALVSSLVAALVQHFLSLRADMIRWKRERTETLRKSLLGGGEAALEALEKHLELLEDRFDFFLTKKGEEEEEEEE